MESGDPTVMASAWKNSLYIAAGQDPFMLVDKAVAAAAQLSGGALPRQEKRQPDSLNWFGWCTWDAYYSKVSARGVQLTRCSMHTKSAHTACNSDLTHPDAFGIPCSMQD